MKSSLCLGTVQFGMDYGVTNINGKVSESEIKEILNKASNYKIKYLDTAQSYGNSEEVLGRCMPPDKEFKIISKLSPLKNKSISKEEINTLEQNIHKTLSDLKCDFIDSFLLHRSDDLKNEDSDLLLNWLISLQKRKLVKKIGVSIYHESELNGLPMEKIQVIQVPVSLYNQNILSNKIVESITNLGIEIHARSCFLQGLLLSSSINWPEFISTDFRKHHQRLEEHIIDLNISLLDICIAFIKSLSFLDKIIIGITSPRELDQLIESWEKADKLMTELKFDKWAWENKNDMDPRSW